MTKISLSHICKIKILDDLNLTIKKGEKVGIIGESGVGKTTLINILMGLVFPSKGNILVDGIKLKKKIFMHGGKIYLIYLKSFFI